MLRAQGSVLAVRFLNRSIESDDDNFRVCVAAKVRSIEIPSPKPARRLNPPGRSLSHMLLVQHILQTSLDQKVWRSGGIRGFGVVVRKMFWITGSGSPGAFRELGRLIEFLEAAAYIFPPLQCLLNLFSRRTPKKGYRCNGELPSCPRRDQLAVKCWMPGRRTARPDGMPSPCACSPIKVRGKSYMVRERGRQSHLAVQKL